MEIKWIKLSTDIFSNRKIRYIEAMPERDVIIIIWVKLLVLAGEINDGGLIYFTHDIPFTPSTLAIQMDRSEEAISKALKIFRDLNMIDVRDDGMIEVLNWERYQNIEGMEKIREQNRKRQQKKRAKDRSILGNMLCAYCGDPADSVDHIIPISREGKDDADNLVPACLHCNMEKTNRDLDIFLNDRLFRGEHVEIESILANPKLNRYVTFNQETQQFEKCDSCVTNNVTNGVTHATDKNRKEKIRIEQDKKGDSKGKTIAETDPQELLRRLTKQANHNAIFGTDMEVNGR